MARPTGRDLRSELIREATAAIQTDGTSFSLQQLAERLGVRAPSLHHHFRRKSDLIDAAAVQYIAAFKGAVDKLDGMNAVDRLTAYVDVFTAPSREGRFCLCGALTADWQDTSPAMQERIRAFFDGQRVWVEQAVAQGQAAEELRSDVDPEAFASGFIAALEGALLLARVVPNRAASDGPLEILRLACA